MDGGQFELDGTKQRIDSVELSANAFHVLDEQGKGYRIELIDHSDNVVKLKVNGSVYEASVTSPEQELLKKMGMNDSASKKMSVLKAPMPGLVLDVKVEPGQVVVEGDVLVILEAMKMENAIAAVSEGTVKTIEIIKGNTVEKNQAMITFI